MQILDMARLLIRLKESSICEVFKAPMKSNADRLKLYSVKIKNNE